MSFYKVCIDRVEGDNEEGLAYRNSPTLDDCDTNSIAAWGSSVWGIKEGDFVKVGQQYLPTHVSGELVLIQEGSADEGDMKQQLLPESLNDKPVHMQDDKSPTSKHSDREMITALSRLHLDIASVRSESSNAKEFFVKKLAMHEEQFKASVSSLVETMNQFELRLNKLGGLVRLCQDFEVRLTAQEAAGATHEPVEVRLAGIESAVQAIEARLATHEARLEQKNQVLQFCGDAHLSSTLPEEATTKTAGLMKLLEGKHMEEQSESRSESDAKSAENQGPKEQVMPEVHASAQDMSSASAHLKSKMQEICDLVHTCAAEIKQLEDPADGQFEKTAPSAEFVDFSDGTPQSSGTGTPVRRASAPSSTSLNCISMLPSSLLQSSSETESSDLRCALSCAAQPCAAASCVAHVTPPPSPSMVTYRSNLPVMQNASPDPLNFHSFTNKATTRKTVGCANGHNILGANVDFQGMGDYADKKFYSEAQHSNKQILTDLLIPERQDCEPDLRNVLVKLRDATQEIIADPLKTRAAKFKNLGPSEKTAQSAESAGVKGGPIHSPLIVRTAATPSSCTFEVAKSSPRGHSTSEQRARDVRCAVPSAALPGVIASCVAQASPPTSPGRVPYRSLSPGAQNMPLDFSSTPVNSNMATVRTVGCTNLRSVLGGNAEVEGVEDHSDKQSCSEAQLAEKQSFVEQVIPELHTFESDCESSPKSLKDATQDASAERVNTRAADFRHLGEYAQRQSEKTAQSASLARFGGSLEVPANRMHVRAVSAPSSPSFNFRSILGDGGKSFGYPRPSSSRVQNSSEKSISDVHRAVPSAAQSAIGSCAASVSAPNSPRTITYTYVGPSPQTHEAPPDQSKLRPLTSAATVRTVG